MRDLDHDSSYKKGKYNLNKTIQTYSNWLHVKHKHMIILLDRKIFTFKSI